MSKGIICGDMIEVLPTLPENHFDGCLTDPPYHFTSVVKRFGKEGSAPTKSDGAYGRASTGFMGQSWDGGDIAFRPETWAKVLRVLKPGAHLAAFGAPKNVHRLTCAIEDAGFEIRDVVFWCFGTGFPKSHNGKGEAKGFGTAFKPAYEPIIVARKPLIGTIEKNFEKFGTGYLNIDAGRVLTEDNLNGGVYSKERKPSASELVKHGGTIHNSTGLDYKQPEGRWPANIMHDGGDEVLAAFPHTKSGKPSGVKAGNNNKVFGQYGGGIPVTGFGDEGSAARFFYCAKATKTDREEGNNHPTVKPTDLMKWLCRVIVPPGGHVIDPFSGSGSTGKAALQDGFRFTGIEKSDVYAAIAKARIEASIPEYLQ